MAAESWQVRSFALLRWPESILNPWILSLQCSTYFNMSFNFALTKSRYVFTKHSETHHFRFLARSSLTRGSIVHQISLDSKSFPISARRWGGLQKLSRNSEMCSASPFRNKPISAVTLLNSWTHLHILTPLVAQCNQIIVRFSHVVYVRLFPFDFCRLESFLNGSETMCY